MPPFTLGVEEEFQIIDPQSWELRSHVSELLESAAVLGDQIKRELHQSIVEVGTQICRNVAELRAEIFRTRRELTSAAERVGLVVGAAGTHPFAHWENQMLSPGVRYEGGPEEGTAALTQRSAPATFDPNSIKSPPGVRYDGGPEEGSRGALSSDAPSNAISGIRYDGGPEEGSRGSGR